tara:strand:- start:1787 stop:1990 length:204 start_codon:yes stop_codon:yes gene_type:complete
MDDKELLELFIEVGHEYDISEEKFEEIMPCLIKVSTIERKRVGLRRQLVLLRRYYTALTGIENPHLQ